MKIRHGFGLLGAVLALSLAACSRETPADSAPGSTTEQPPAAEGSAEATAPEPVENRDPTGSAYTVPSTLADCAQGRIVTLKWDFRTSHPNVSDLEVYTGAPGKETLFAAGGNPGEAATGPWAYPGTVFLLKDKASGEELTQVKVLGPDCPPA